MLPALNAEKPGFERDSVSVSPDTQRAALRFPEKPGFFNAVSPLPTPYSRSRNSPTVSCKGGFGGDPPTGRGHERSTGFDQF